MATRSVYFLEKLDQKRQLDSDGTMRNFVLGDVGFHIDALTTAPPLSKSGVPWFNIESSAESLCDALRASGADCKLVVGNGSGVKAVLENHVVIENAINEKVTLITKDIDTYGIAPAGSDLDKKLRKIVPSNLERGDVPQIFVDHGFDSAALHNGDTSKFSLMKDGMKTGFQVSNVLFGIGAEKTDEILLQVRGNKNEKFTVLDPKMIILQRSVGMPESPETASVKHKLHSEQVSQLLYKVYGSINEFVYKEKEFVERHNASLTKVGVSMNAIVGQLQNAVKVFLSKKDQIPEPVFNMMNCDKALTQILRNSHWSNG